jgi:hypothetical protein
LISEETVGNFHSLLCNLKIRISLYHFIKKLKQMCIGKIGFQIQLLKFFRAGCSGRYFRKRLSFLISATFGTAHETKLKAAIPYNIFMI